MLSTPEGGCPVDAFQPNGGEVVEAPSFPLLIGMEAPSLPHFLWEEALSLPLLLEMEDPGLPLLL